MHEAQIKSLKDEARKLNVECERLRSETEQLRLDKENLSKGKFDLERNVNALKVRKDSMQGRWRVGAGGYSNRYQNFTVLSFQPC